MMGQHEVPAFSVEWEAVMGQHGLPVFPVGWGDSDGKAWEVPAFSVWGVDMGQYWVSAFSVAPAATCSEHSTPQSRDCRA